MIDDMQELIGKVVREVYINDDQRILAFVTEDGIVAYETWADCCSETWFADITGISALIGNEVRTAENIKLESVEDGRCRQEYDLFYGVKLTTQSGVIDIVYRNSSNGYYCGSIEQIELMSVSGMKPILDDWAA